MGGIKTIDELLASVAENLNVAPPEPKKHTLPAKPTAVQTPIKAVKPETVQTECRMDLKTAKKLALAVENAAEKIGISVVTAIMNEGARLVCLEAMDYSYIASVEAAQQKAYTAAALKMPTYKALEEARGGSLDGLTNGSGILLLAGGEPLFCNGKLIGAVGVSGGTKEQDALLAKVAAVIFEIMKK